MTTSEILSLIRYRADNLGVCPDLAVAIAYTESSLNSLATRYEPAWKYFNKPDHFAALVGVTTETERMQQATSWGLMQVMGSVARELGFTGSLPALCDPATGVQYGCLKLKKLCDKYEDETAVIAAYNAGTPRKLPGGKWENQPYVDKVTAKLRTLRAIGG